MTLIHQHLTNSAKKYPEKDAIVCGSDRLSFFQLELQSNNLAEYLQNSGVKTGDRVGIFCGKSLQEVVAIFAILKIGALIVHINPMFKESQLTHLLGDCGIKALFIDCFKAGILNKAYSDQYPLEMIIALSDGVELSHSPTKSIPTVDSITESSPSNDWQPANIAPDDMAAIVYTSGSTGMPKGIIITHRILTESSAASIAVLKNNRDDRLISVTPFSFDGALSQLLTAVQVGGTLVQQLSNFPRDIVRTLLEEKITGFHAVPSLWNMMLQPHSPFTKKSYPDLRYISIIGERFPQKQLKRLRDILINTEIYMMYGTTEAFRSTYLSPEEFEKKPNSVGRPFPGVEIAVIDEQGGNCPPDQPGEIVHRGAFISPGYWENTEMTAEVFIDGAVYTGDIGKLDDEGHLYFIGRNDGMIKTNGFRVSPGEIEHCIDQLDHVQEVAVLALSDESSATKIKAAIVCKQDSSLTNKDIVRHCRNHLPLYMVPEVICFMDSLPKTANRKIDRSKLSPRED